jgi:hypothetical protein
MQLIIVKPSRPARKGFIGGFFDGSILEWRTGADSSGLSILWIKSALQKTKNPSSPVASPTLRTGQDFIALAAMAL